MSNEWDYDEKAHEILPCKTCGNTGRVGEDNCPDCPLEVWCRIATALHESEIAGLEEIDSKLNYHGGCHTCGLKDGARWIDADEFQALIDAKKGEDREESAMSDKTFPVCRSGGMTIPYELAQRAYLVYAKKYGTSQPLDRMGQRGGFYPEELDEFVPGWREELSELNALKKQLGIALESADSMKRTWNAACAEITELKAKLEAAEQQISDVVRRMGYDVDAAYIGGLEAAISKIQALIDTKKGT